MKKTYLVLHLAVIIAGFTGIFGKLITLNEGLLVWYRVFFSAIWLCLIVNLMGIGKGLTTRQKLKIARVGVLITIHWLFFYGSIKYSNISIGVVCFSLTSFFTAIFKPLLERRRFVPTEIGLSFLTLTGIACIFHFDASYQLGIVLGVISAAFAALYTIFNERLVNDYDSKVINYYQMIGGTVVLGLFMPLYLHFFPVASLIPSLRDIIYLQLLALICTAGLYVMFAESLKRLSAFTVNLTFNLEPIYSIIIAFLFFDEGRQVNASFYVGLFFVATSVILQTLISVRKHRKLSV